MPTLTRRRILLAASASLAILTGCTAAQQQAAVQIAASALPCYTAVASAVSSGSLATKILTGASVAATSAACAGVDSATLTLIASALNTGATVTPAPASTVAGMRAPPVKE